MSRWSRPADDRQHLVDSDREKGNRHVIGERGDYPAGLDCYPSGTVVLTQLGVLENLSAAFE
jgi:hypothetical protein